MCFYVFQLQHGSKQLPFFIPQCYYSISGSNLGINAVNGACFQNLVTFFDIARHKAVGHAHMFTNSYLAVG